MYMLSWDFIPVVELFPLGWCFIIREKHLDRMHVEYNTYTYMSFGSGVKQNVIIKLFKTKHFIKEHVQLE